MAGTHRRTAPAPSPAASTATGRDRYFDVLRAVALVRVVTYHTFEWPWLGYVFPSMGVMFALAGSLMARSLERPAPAVLRSRLRRLMVPVWLFGLVLGVAMLLHGWVPGPDVLLWVLPVGDPPGDAWGEQAWAVLWYLRAYLWFVLLSPLLLRLFRLAPLPVLVLSLMPVAVLETVSRVPDGRLGSALSDASVFLFCWLLGFAHRDGVLDRLRAPGPWPSPRRSWRREPGGLPGILRTVRTTWTTSRSPRPCGRRVSSCSCCVSGPASTGSCVIRRPTGSSRCSTPAR